MRRDQLKDIINITSVIAAVLATSIPILLFNMFSINRNWMLAAIAVSAYAAVVSVYISRMRERRLRQRRIFIIYGNRDRDKAFEIVKHLRELGYNPWFDVDEIAPGQKWAQAVMKGIEESSVALLLVSENLKAGDGFVAKEIEAAMSAMRSRDETFSPVIPIRLDDTPVPEQVRDIHWVDIRNKEGYEQLEKGLKRVLGQGS